MHRTNWWDRNKMKPSVKSLLRQTRQANQNLKTVIEALGRGTHTKEDEIELTRTFNKIMLQNQSSEKARVQTTKAIIERSSEMLSDYSSQASKRNASQIRYQIDPIDEKLKKSLTSSSSSTRSESINVEYLNLERRAEILTAIEPTLNKMMELETDYELMVFLQNLVIKFNSTKTSSAKFNNDLVSKINKKSISSPLDPILNQFTLPILIEKGIQQLANNFKSSQEALTVFEMIKNLNLRTFIYCITIETYNEIIKIYWRDFQDISMISTLIEELKVNGIQGNLETIQALTRISIEMHRLLNGESEEDSGYEISLFEFDKEFGLNPNKNKSTPVYNKRDEDILLEIDQYINDLNKSVAL